EIQDEILIKIPLEDCEVELKLNSEQYKAFLKILDCIQNGKGVIFLIDESTETGKIFLYLSALCLSGFAELLCKAQLFLCDEPPTAKPWAIENVDKLLKVVMKNDKNFVKKTTIYQIIFANLMKPYF
ncbi:hypothetical protein Pfo_030201, partial [Paulownia fortunei]